MVVWVKRLNKLQQFISKVLSLRHYFCLSFLDHGIRVLSPILVYVYILRNKNKNEMWVRVVGGG